MRLLSSYLAYLPSVANAPVLGPGCTGRSARPIGRLGQGYRVSSRSRTPPLLSSQGSMNFRDPQPLPFHEHLYAEGSTTRPMNSTAPVSRSWMKK